MKARLALFGLVSAVALIGIAGCSRSDTVAEGVIYYVEYQNPGGGTAGFTRVNDSKAVPGGNGTWDIDAYGRLTPEFLVITRPQRPELGQQVIPVSRLVSVQFGDGGIKEVNEGKQESTEVICKTSGLTRRNCRPLPLKRQKQKLGKHPPPRRGYGGQGKQKCSKSEDTLRYWERVSFGLSDEDSMS